MDPRTQVAICKVCSSSTTKVLSKPDHQNLSLEGGFIVPPIGILQQTEHVSDSLPEGQRWRDEVYEGRNTGLPLHPARPCKGGRARWFIASSMT